MNVHAAAVEIPAGISPEEWSARVDLAAVYRLCAHNKWDDLIFNHCAMRVPGEPGMMLMKRHELLWTEVTASNLVKADIYADLDEKAGVNRPGFTQHGAVMQARPDVHCSIHVHTRIGTAISGLKSGLRMVSQPAVRFYKRMGYHPYEGITEDFAERERIIANLGSNWALIMHNHGLLTVGRSARHAFRLMNQLFVAAEIQLLLEATGNELVEIPPEVCEKVSAQLDSHDLGRGSADWPAYLRLMDGVDPSYRT